MERTSLDRAVGETLLTVDLEPGARELPGAAAMDWTQGRVEEARFPRSATALLSPSETTASLGGMKAWDTGLLRSGARRQSLTVATVPEPRTGALVALGALGLSLLRRRSRAAALADRPR